MKEREMMVLALQKPLQKRAWQKSQRTLHAIFISPPPISKILDLPLVCIYNK